MSFTREGLRIDPAAAAAELVRRARAARGFCPHEATPKQTEFLALDCLEALYGGAAGGGKTDALLAAAAQYVHVPGYAALILRRTHTDLVLPGAILDRAKAWWIPAGVAWSEREKRFRFPSGATIAFGYCDNETDKFRYQGAEIQFLGIDELTQWPEGWYRYLLSRLRRPDGMTVPVRARSATNPGGIGHEWVKRRFIDEDTRKGTFVPANLADNPHIDQSEYRKSLARLDPVTRKQLEEGIWIRDPSGLVYARFDERANVIRSAPACFTPGHADFPRVFVLLAQDYGTTNATSWNILGWREHDPVVYVLRSWKKVGLTPSENADVVHELEQTWHFHTMVGDVGGLGKAYAEEARKRFHLPIEPADKNNKRGYIELFNGDLASGRILVVGPECQDLVAELTTLPWNETREKEAAGFENHCADGTLYGWRRACAYAERPKEEKPKPGSRAAVEAMESRLEELATAEAADEGPFNWGQ